MARSGTETGTQVGILSPDSEDANNIFVKDRTNV